MKAPLYCPVHTHTERRIEFDGLLWPIMTTIRKHASTLIKIGVTLLGLAFVLSQIELRTVSDTLLQAKPGWVVVTFALILLSLVVRAIRWLFLLRGLGVTLSVTRLVALYFVGSFFNAFLPTSFGGDVMRVIEVTRDVPAEVAAGTVIVDRLSGLLMLFAMALFALPFRPPDFPAQLLTLVIIVAVIGLVGGFILLQGTLLRRLGRFLPAILSPTGHGPVARVLAAVNAVGWPAVMKALAVSLVFNVILVLWWWSAGRALEFEISFTHYLLVIPILSISLLVPSIGGLGPREVVAQTLFASQLNNDQAVALSLLVFFLQRLSGVLGGPIYLWMVVRGKQTRATPPASRVTHAPEPSDRSR